MVADALFALAGYGVLNAIGILRGALWEFVAAVGLAFLAGVSFVVTLGIAFLTLGVPFRLPAFVAVSTTTFVAGMALRRDWLHALRSPRLREFSLRRVPAQAWVAVPTLGAFLFLVEEGVQALRWRPLVEWDAWSIWSRKAEMLFHTGTLPTDFFASSAYAFMHPDYPILIPVFESLQYRAMGTVNTQAIHWQFFLLLVAFVLAVLYLGLRRGTLLEWLPLAIVVVVVPAVSSQLVTAYADIPAALFLALGAVLLGEWLRTRETALLALSIVMLAASASTKNEGLMASVVVLAVAVAATALARRRSDLRLLALGAGAFVLAILPWRIWLVAHGVHGDIPVLKGLEPWYLAGRADRVLPSLRSLYAQLIDQTSWLWVIPLGLVVTAFCLAVERMRAIAAFYLASGGADVRGSGLGLLGEPDGPARLLPRHLLLSRRGRARGPRVRGAACACRPGTRWLRNATAGISTYSRVRRDSRIGCTKRSQVPLADMWQRSGPGSAPSATVCWRPA